jgi:serine/threonine protein kinase
MQILLMLFLHIYLVFLLAFNSRVFGVSFDENISVTENSLVPLTETSVRVLPFNHTTTVLLGGVDGRVSALSLETGAVLWTVSTGGALLRSSHTPIVPSVRGEIYVYAEDRVRRHPLDVRTIVNYSPLVLDRGEGIVYLGHKTTTLWAVDPNSGHLTQCFDVAPNWSPRCSFWNTSPITEDASRTSSLRTSAASTLYFARVDYFVAAIDLLSGTQKWNVTYGEYVSHPLFSGRPPTETSEEDITLSKRGQNESLQVVGLLVGMDGSVARVDLTHRTVQWKTSLHAPALYLLTHTALPLFVRELLLDADTTPRSHILLAEHAGQMFALSATSSTAASFVSATAASQDTSPHTRWREMVGVWHTRLTEPFVPLLPSGPSSPLLIPSLSSPPTAASEHVAAQTTSLSQCVPFVALQSNESEDVTFQRVNVANSEETTATGNVTHRLFATEAPLFTVATTLSSPHREGTHSQSHAVAESVSRDNCIAHTHRYPSALTAHLVVIIFVLVAVVLLLFAVFLVPGQHFRTSARAPSAATTRKKTSKLKSKKNKSAKSLSSATRTKSEYDAHAVDSSLRSNDTLLLSNTTTRVGQLEITSHVLGYGSSGTVVFLGYFSGRKVAVKRLLLDFLDPPVATPDDSNHTALHRATLSRRALREIELLIQSDEHPNVIRYYHHEYDDKFLYLALQYCPLSLHQLLVLACEYEKTSRDHQRVEEQNVATAQTTLSHSVTFAVDNVDNVTHRLSQCDLAWFSTLDAKKHLLLQLVNGVVHLHSRNIVHRDLKPQNVLIDVENRLVKISDMGLAKKVTPDTSRCSTELGTKFGAVDSNATNGEDAVGTCGWRAPELLTSPHVKVTPSVDIFALGCIMHYVLTYTHPFGQRYEREMRILRGDYSLHHSLDPEARDLIQQMVVAEPNLRPTIQTVLTHPFWWPPSKRLSFLKDASDYLEFLPATHPTVKAFHQQQAVVLGHLPHGSWLDVLDPSLKTDLNRYRKYNPTNLRDLLRVIRNKAHHYRDLEPEMQQRFGALPEGYLHYFTSRFPQLLMYTYHFIGRTCREDPTFRDYFNAHSNSGTLLDIALPHHSDSNSFLDNKNNNQKFVIINGESRSSPRTGDFKNATTSNDDRTRERFT